jgi:hypothetical protein
LSNRHGAQGFEAGAQTWRLDDPLQGIDGLRIAIPRVYNVEDYLAVDGWEYLINVVVFVLVLGFAVWLYGRFVRMEYSKITQWIFTLLALILILGAGYLYLPYQESPVALEHKSENPEEMIPMHTHQK